MALLGLYTAREISAPENERYLQPVIGCPVVIVRQTDPFPWEPTLRWTDW
jgi:hypothetical protein